MNDYELMVYALDMMHRDGPILNYFWREFGSGLTSEEKYKFDRFYELTEIDQSIKKFDYDYAEVISDHTEFMEAIKKADKKVIMAAEMSFIIIICAAGAHIEL